MNSEPRADSKTVALAASELAHLQRQSEQVREELSGLQQNLVSIKNGGEGDQKAQLREANEHLIQAALLAHDDADIARHALETMAQLAERDTLTNLPNRLVMLDRLTQGIAMAKRAGRRLAVLFIDLDDFKQINDTLGHATGDEVLKQVAQRLSSAVRDADTVSRHGGDEFLILLPELFDRSNAAAVADNVITSLATPMRLGEHVMRMGVSIGISIYPDDGDEAEVLIQLADAAMYHAKRQAGDGIAFYSGEVVGASPEGAVVKRSLQRPLVRYDEALLKHERLQAQLCEANEQLVMAALSAQDLQAAAEQAHRKLQELLAFTAHELRAPLAPIRLATSMLAHVRPEKLPGMQALIERQVVHMSELIADLVDVSRIQSGKLRVDHQNVDIVPAIHLAIEACRPAMDLRLQRFRMQLPTDAVRVRGDPVRLVQVVTNLLTNASKYTQEGGWIKLRVVPTDMTIVITVTDNGIGISAVALPDIFKPFVQDEHAIGFNGTGLGIGLTVVRELVEAHGGSIEATSDGVGMGSRFVVTLPLVAAALPGM